MPVRLLAGLGRGVGDESQTTSGRGGWRRGDGLVAHCSRAMVFPPRPGGLFERRGRLVSARFQECPVPNHLAESILAVQRQWRCAGERSYREPEGKGWVRTTEPEY